ncbi:unnamed protein product [Prorocentrum cordatum]|uniref:N-acetylgalactosaminide beta-1,3-galactosyltransferase n=1 Tax=Prorocentrum cordatum TaxID=2364126 RepID=A0ABN9V1Z6_9DINO|nr:unnamed protein product [Polarella glacialis]
MASRTLSERASLMEEAWRESPVQRLYLVDDWLGEVPRELQWRFEPDPGGGDVTGYWDAQSRQLEYMRAHPSIVGRAKWVILADDDTWVYVDRLLGFVADHDPAVPVLFTYVLSDAHVLGYDYPCGGAGMLLSAAAYELVAPRLLTPDCPLIQYNDLTLGFCVHAHGVPMVHHPNMHCSPDVNRAMRAGENLMDLHWGLSVHRLPAFGAFPELVETVGAMHSQLPFLLRNGCRLAAKSSSATLDLRLFYWTVDAFPSAVDKCRAGADGPSVGGPIHLEFLIFGGGKAVARYHEERQTPLMAPPGERAARWPDWFVQLRRLGCTGHEDTWSARWLDAAPRVSRRQVAASDLDALAAGAGVAAEELRASYEALRARSPRGSWLQELQRESVRLLRALSDLYYAHGGAEARLQAEDSHRPVRLGDTAPPPLALAYEFSSLHVEQDAGVWLNGVAMSRLLHCPALTHPIVLHAEAHANDWDTVADRLRLLWHNALAVDVFRTLRFCGVVVLHAPQMIPHALAYLPYSTYRRPHAPSVATALTLGNVMSREQTLAMSQLVSRRACRERRGARALERERGGWRPPFRMRSMGLSERRRARCRCCWE